ncbi:MAG: helix-turn-helix domain-containing protein [Gammaproteobacteria bacterium]
MQVQRIGYRVRAGKGALSDRGSWFEMGQDCSQHRKETQDPQVKFWQDHGLAATMAAFEVSRRTLFAWKRRLKAASPAGLGPHSTRPKRIRRPLWPESLMAEIRRLRRAHPNLEREKLKVLLERFGQERDIVIPSERTRGRIIAAAPRNPSKSPGQGLERKADGSVG